MSQQPPYGTPQPGPWQQGPYGQQQGPWQQGPYGQPAGLYTQVLVPPPYRCSTAHVVVAWILAVLTLGYLLPWAIAATRNRPNVAAIALIDLFLGWSLVGWVVSLVMACGTDPAPVVVTAGYGPGTGWALPPQAGVPQGYPAPAAPGWTSPPVAPPAYGPAALPSRPIPEPPTPSAPEPTLVDPWASGTEPTQPLGNHQTWAPYDPEQDHRR